MAEAAEKKKRRTFRKYTYRGVDLDQLLDMTRWVSFESVRITRMHSSRVRTIRALTLFPGSLPPGGGGLPSWRGLLPGGSALPGGQTPPPPPPPPRVHRMTDACENITFARYAAQAVIMDCTTVLQGIMITMQLLVMQIVHA